MKAVLALLCTLSLFAAPVLAQDKKDEKKKAPSAAQMKQQERMRDCNVKAAEKKGDERKKFMSSCLKADSAKGGAKMTEQQSRMKDCNRQAGDKGLKGDERKAYMSSCLKR